MRVPKVNSFPKIQNKDLPSLDFYWREVRKIVSALSKKMRPGLAASILKNEDALAFIVFEVIKRDCVHDESKSKASTHRFKSVRWAIGHLTKNIKERGTYEPLHDNTNLAESNTLCNPAYIAERNELVKIVQAEISKEDWTEDEKQIISTFFLGGGSVNDVVKSLKTTHYRAKYLIDEVRLRLQRRLQDVN